MRHSEVETKQNEAIAALEAKVGVDGSSDTDSLDWKINNLDIEQPIAPAHTKSNATQTISTDVDPIVVNSWPDVLAAIALGVDGDDFPRIVVYSGASPGIVFGDGTEDPVSGAATGTIYHEFGNLWLKAPAQFAYITLSASLSSPLDGAVLIEAGNITSPNPGGYPMTAAEQFGSGALANGYSVALGYNASAGGYTDPDTFVKNVAIGAQSVAEGTLHTVIGAGAEVVGGETYGVGPYERCVIIGSDSQAYDDGRRAVVIGNETFASGDTAVSIGGDASAEGNYAVVIGANAADSDGEGCVVIGYFAQTLNAWDHTIAIGYGAYGDGGDSIAIGNTASTLDSDAIAIGKDTQAYANTVAIGNTAIAGEEITIAIGYFQEVAYTYSVALGFNADIQAEHAIGIGYFNEIDADSAGAVVIGDQVSATTASKAIALGWGAFIGGDYGIAIGYQAYSDGGIAIGGTGSSYTYAAAGEMMLGGSELTKIGFGIDPFTIPAASSISTLADLKTYLTNIGLLT